MRSNFSRIWTQFPVWENFNPHYILTVTINCLAYNQTAKKCFEKIQKILLSWTLQFWDIILQFISKMNNSSLCTLNTTISTWFWVRFKVFNHSGKNYLLTFKNNFRRRHPSYRFFEIFLCYEVRRRSFIISRGLTNSL